MCYISFLAWLNGSFFDFLQDKFGFGTPPFTNITAILFWLVVVVAILCMFIKFIPQLVGGIIGVVVMAFFLMYVCSGLRQCQDQSAAKRQMEELFSNPYK